MRATEDEVLEAHRLGLRRTGLLILVVVPLAVLAVAVLTKNRPSPQRARVATKEARVQSPSKGILFRSLDEWRVSLDEAQTRASFRLVLPDTALANRQNVTAVYLEPSGNVVLLIFPLQKASERFIRQDHIKVYEGVWTGGDPLKDYQRDLASEHVVGKELSVIGDTPVLLVSAHSPSDDEQANPAFLGFVMDGVEFQISGGESLQDLIDIAKTILARHSGS
jgi:hypothetical protein